MIWILGYIFIGHLVILFIDAADNIKKAFNGPDTGAIVLIVLWMWPIIISLILFRSIKERFKK